MGNYLVQNTPSGLPTLVHVAGKQTRIHSAYDPQKEAKKSIEAFSPGRASVIIVCGLGLGYHVAELRRAHPSCRIIVLEKDDEVVRLAHSVHPDAIQGVSVITKVVEIPDVLEYIDMASFRGAIAFRHRPSYLLFKEFYDALEKDVHQYFSSRLSDMLTRFEFTERWVENILQNAHHLFRSISVKTLFGQFRGMAGIIVSAGPSLRKNVSLLKNAKDKALIVCVDTAFKILEKYGVTPHIVMTLDAQRHSVRHFLGVRMAEPVLLADLVSCPVVLRDYPGQRMLSTTSKFTNMPDGKIIRETTPLVNWLEQWIESPGDIQSGGSVATSAFDLLLNLGCSPIVLIGQDLAYTGREIHCSGSHHNEEWIGIIDRFRNLECINQGVIRKRKIKRVEAYGGKGTVISDFVFDLYRSWFADSARKVPVPVINATEGGARIAHTQELPLIEVLKTLPRRTNPDGIIRKAIETCNNKKRDGKQLLNAITRAIEHFEDIIELSKQGDSIKNAIIEKALEEDIKHVIAPLIKKTEVYLARHPDLSPQRVVDILSGDIIKACTTLHKRFVKTKQNLEQVLHQSFF